MRKKYIRVRTFINSKQLSGISHSFFLTKLVIERSAFYSFLSKLIMFKQRRTKIVCTLGPATNSEKMIHKLVLAGMDCARLNFSHGTLDEHHELISIVRRVSLKTGKQVAILQDLPGPKFRVGNLPQQSIQLKKGATVLLTSLSKESNEKDGKNIVIPLRSNELPRYAPAGGMIFLSDGQIRLKILNSTKTTIECKCEIGGTLYSGKGINVPTLKRGFRTFTKADRKFLAFGLENDIDLIAVSFVRSASDIELVREFAEKRTGGKDTPPIIAKIEKRDAVDNIDQIVNVSDAVMVARGDLGVENPLELVPELQKQIISRSNNAGVPVITATQMLESMVNNPTPTRAEVTDAANAIFDGTDALMLSEETAIGKYPVECVETLNRVAINAEERMIKEQYHKQFLKPKENGDGQRNLAAPEAIFRAAVSISNEIGASSIVTLLESIKDVSRISRLRPSSPTVAISSNQAHLRRLRIVWGVEPIWAGKTKTFEERVSTIQKLLKLHGFLNGGNEKFVLVGTNPGLSTQSLVVFSAK